jgi:hypothetical protein
MHLHQTGMKMVGVTKIIFGNLIQMAKMFGYDFGRPRVEVRKMVI